MYGRNRRIYYERNTEDKPTVAGDIDLKPAQTDNIVDYSASVSFQEWMDGCSVSLVRVDCGCCGDSQVISDTKHVERFPIEPYYPELIYLRPHHEGAKTREISGSAFIDFPVSKTFNNPTYRNTTAKLKERVEGEINGLVGKDFVGAAADGFKAFYTKNIEPANGDGLKKLLEAIEQIADAAKDALPGNQGLDDQLAAGNNQ